MFRTILCSDQVNSGKKQKSHVKFWFNKKNIELPQIYLAVMDVFYDDFLDKC